MQQRLIARKARQRADYRGDREPFDGLHEGWDAGGNLTFSEREDNADGQTTSLGRLLTGGRHTLDGDGQTVA